MWTVLISFRFMFSFKPRDESARDVLLSHFPDMETEEARTVPLPAQRHPACSPLPAPPAWSLPAHHTVSLTRHPTTLSTKQLGLSQIRDGRIILKEWTDKNRVSWNETGASASWLGPCRSGPVHSALTETVHVR